jgi:hypothetical protein
VESKLDTLIIKMEITSLLNEFRNMFFKWKLDMLANITLARIAQCMKFKLLYDDWIRTHLLKRNNKPVITSFHGYQTRKCIKKKNRKRKIKRQQQQQQQHQLQLR